jgi:hypothetical protein
MFAEFVRPSLYQGVMGHALNRAIRSTQLDLDFSRFMEQLLQPLLQLDRSVKIGRLA